MTSSSDGLERVEALLRGDAGIWLGTEAARTWRLVLPLSVAAGLFYGAVMGTYGFHGPADRPIGAPALQMLYSACKVPVLLGAATALCLPGLGAFLAAIGLRASLAPILRGIVASQATVMVGLAALAPLTALLYVSTADYALAKAFNGLAFALASGAGQWTLARHFRPLVRADRRCRIGLVLWLVLYVFVGVQLAWVLRPFIGNPAMPVTFLREDAWGNAYVEVARVLRKILEGTGS